LEAREDLSRLGSNREWANKLTSLVEEYAIHQGLDYMMLLPAAENSDVNDIKFPLEKAKKIYDQTAEARGYEYDRNLRRYIKSLEF
jgi:hypothetical protein